MEHLEQIFRTAHRQLRPRTTLPDIQVEFFPFAGINHTARLAEGKLSVRVSDICQDAPSEVYHSLALILLAKLYRKKIDDSHHRTYRQFILRSEIQERARTARNSRTRIARRSGPQGRHINLEEVFENLNARYFQGALHKPNLSWSQRKSRCVLGRYDSGHDVIFISRLFDAPNIPPYVTAYVMFHEMLHVKHQTRVDDCRLISHTPEFRREERTFDEYSEAKSWLAV
jgi:predicted metal-dependent hydrolase